MKLLNHRIFLLAALFVSLTAQCQVSILSSSLSEFNISPQSISQASVSNMSTEGSVVLEAQLTNSAGEVVLKTRSNPFQLKTGISVIGLGNLTFESVALSGSAQSSFIKTQHRLPSGLFNHCVRIVPISGVEQGDEWCQQINAEQEGFLYLVYPSDKETIETKRPLLNWMHSEPFNLLTAGEFFRLKVVELDKNQSAQAGVEVNTPVMTKSYLRSHQVQYSADLNELEEGKRYGWMVEKIANGVIINKTEAWEFNLEKNEIKEHLYVELARKTDASYYQVQNDKIYFKFREKYQSTTLDITILDKKGEVITPEAKNLSSNLISEKKAGYNRYILDLSSYNLKKGYHKLVVKNGKQDKFQLKFYAE